MERSLPSMLFLVASVAFSIAFGGWWMQRVAFTPQPTRESAAAMLNDADIRGDLISLISTISAPTIGKSTTEIGTEIETVVFASRPGAAMMAPIMERAQTRVIGESEDPVQITSEELVQILRDDQGITVAPFTVPIEPIGILKTTNSALRWIVPIGAGLALVLFVFGVFTRPERRDVLRGIAEFLLSIAASLLLLGYAIPVYLFTALDNRTWAHVVPELARSRGPVVFGIAIVCVVAGTLLWLNSNTGTKRRQWSTPLSMTRYRGGDNPGWG